MLIGNFVGRKATEFTMQKTINPSTEGLTKRKDKIVYGIKREISKNLELYILAIPIVAFYLLFCYKPMYGAYMAFTDYSPKSGIFGSPFVGLKHFRTFFTGIYFKRLIFNTLNISLQSIFFGFPAPIILALLMNEIRNRYYQRTIQTITYLPHFISLVVICGMIKDFVSDTGFIGTIVNQLTGNDRSLLSVPEYFVPIYVISDIWQGMGWGSIVYLAALTGIDQQLYEAAQIDGAGRLRQTFHITIPGIMPIVVIMLILRMGSILSVGYEKVILLYNEYIYSTSDVISTYVYRKGLLDRDFSFSSAVGLFNSVISMLFVFGSNRLSRKVNDYGLW